MKSLTLDGDGGVELPTVEVLTGRGFITGKSGSGKSNTASVVIEELLADGFPVLIVDTDGEYWSLKQEYEILHVGADEECDLQVRPEHGEKLAELALEQNVPIILDVSGYLDAEEGSAVVRETARHLFAREKKLNKPFLLLVEEIHEFIPEGGGLDETGEILVRIGKRGRKRGLGLVGISQRPADVKKDFITQCDWLVWHRLTWENDTTVVRRVVGREIADAVPELADGEAFLQADFLEADVIRVQVRRKRTFDAGATPDLGAFDRPELKSVSEELVGELEEISRRDERRRDRVGELEARLAARERQIETLEEELEEARNMSSMAEQFTQAMLKQSDGSAATAKEEELVAENDRLERELTARDERIEVLERRIETLEGYEEQTRRQAELNLAELDEALTRARRALGLEPDDARRRNRPSSEERARRGRRPADELAVDVPSDYADFVEESVVRGAIEEAKEESSPRYVKAIVAGILSRRGPVTQGEIADDLGIKSDENILKGARPLEELGVITMRGRGRDREFDFDIDNVVEIKRQLKRRERLEGMMRAL